MGDLTSNRVSVFAKGHQFKVPENITSYDQIYKSPHYQIDDFEMDLDKKTCRVSRVKIMLSVVNENGIRAFKVPSLELNYNHLTSLCKSQNRLEPLGRKEGHKKLENHGLGENHRKELDELLEIHQVIKKNSWQYLDIFHKAQDLIKNVCEIGFLKNTKGSSMLPPSGKDGLREAEINR